MKSAEERRAEWQAQRKARVNRYGHQSPPAWEQDPYLSSAGDGPGYYAEEDR